MEEEVKAKTPGKLLDDAKLEEMWISALRSGKYEQGRSVLRNRNGQYCCLGVLADLCGDVTPDDMSRSYPSEGRYHGLDFREHIHKLAKMNDVRGLTFAEIADRIEKGDLNG